MGDEIDLTGPIREALLLAIPMKILCSEDCPGLCPQCGKPLATGRAAAKRWIPIAICTIVDLFKTQEKKQEERRWQYQAETLEGKN